MKINVNYEEHTYRIPVWRGFIKDGLVWEKPGKPDFEQSRRRTHTKKYVREQEELEKKLEQNPWWIIKEGM